MLAETTDGNLLTLHCNKTDMFQLGWPFQAAEKEAQVAAA